MCLFLVYIVPVILCLLVTEANFKTSYTIIVLLIIILWFGDIIFFCSAVNSHVFDFFSRKWIRVSNVGRTFCVTELKWISISNKKFSNGCFFLTVFEYEVFLLSFLFLSLVTWICATVHFIISFCCQCNYNAIYEEDLWPASDMSQLQFSDRNLHLKLCNKYGQVFEKKPEQEEKETRINLKILRWSVIRLSIYSPAWLFFQTKKKNRNELKCKNIGWSESIEIGRSDIPRNLKRLYNNSESKRNILIMNIRMLNAVMRVLLRLIMYLYTDWQCI